MSILAMTALPKSPWAVSCSCSAKLLAVDGVGGRAAARAGGWAPWMERAPWWRRERTLRAAGAGCRAAASGCCVRPWTEQAAERRCELMPRAVVDGASGRAARRRRRATRRGGGYGPAVAGRLVGHGGGGRAQAGQRGRGAVAMCSAGGRGEGEAGAERAEEGGMAEEVATAVGELRASFEEGRTRPEDWRAAQLRALVRLVEEREKDISDALHADLAKPHMESYLHEISLVKASCMFALKELKKWMKPQKVPATITTFLSSAQILSEPLGVVLIISAWNYPFLLCIDPIIGAIAAGNAVVVKPSEVAPATASLISRLLPQYVDNSCIKVVEGGIPETTALLEQKWDKILYTGNGKIGRIVMGAAAKHLTPVVLELGGKCPAIVDANVDLHVAAKRLAVGKWGCNNGQACIAPDYIITTVSFAPKLVESLKKVLEKFYGKDPLESPDLSRIVNSNHFNRLTGLMDDKAVAGKIVHGGQRDAAQLKIAPTVLLDVPHDSAIMKEEIFGPLLPIIMVEKIEESFPFINSMTKPLAAYLFSKDKKLQDKFVESISAGGMLINDIALHLTNPHLPFGGVGESGTGAYHGKFSFDAFSHKKAVLTRGFGGETKARYPPYTPQKQNILRGLIKGSFFALILALLGFPREK